MIDVVKVKDKKEGNLKAHNILQKIVNSQTLLALSGGTSPDYQQMIVKPGDIIPGAICVVDERYGAPFHAGSNELLLKNAGVFDLAKRKAIELHKILFGREILETEKDYDKTIVNLFGRFSKRVGVMGIGINLHTAGIFPYSAAAKAPDFVVAEEVEDKQSFSANKRACFSQARNKQSFSANKFPLRITLTLKALGEFQNFVILMFGKEKREALLKMLDARENDMQKYPAIFYRKAFAKSFLITDLPISR